MEQIVDGSVGGRKAERNGTLDEGWRERGGVDKDGGDSSAGMCLIIVALGDIVPVGLCPNFRMRRICPFLAGGVICIGLRECPDKGGRSEEDSGMWSEDEMDGTEEGDET